MGRFDEKFDKDTKDAVARAVIDGLDGKGKGSRVPEVLHALVQGKLTGQPTIMSESYVRWLANRERRRREQLPEHARLKLVPKPTTEPEPNDGCKEVDEHVAWMIDVHNQDVEEGLWKAEWGKNTSDLAPDTRDLRDLPPALAASHWLPSFVGHSTNVLLRSALRAGFAQPIAGVERD